MSDLDHAFPAETLEYLADRPNPGRHFYKLKRKKSDGTFYSGHANLFFMSRARFLRFYGYDEEYCGNYGAEDYRFVKFHKYHGSKQSYLPRRAWCYERDLNREESYHTLVRDLTVNTPIDLRKKHECSTFGPEYGHSRMFLNFDWVMLAQGTRRPFQMPVIRRFWRTLWWWRWFNPWAAR